MRMLGYRTFHTGNKATSLLVDRAAEEDVRLLTYLGDQYDAYFDVAGLVRRFRELDAQYPGSRFILTTRDLEGWLASREKHVLGNEQRTAYPGSWLTIDRDAWVADRERHHAEVLDYFAGRSDLLVFDVARGDGWDKLAGFLGRRPPRRRFPWQNQAGRGTYRPDSRLDRIHRGVDYGVGRIWRLVDERLR
jgi:hypothetical protein